MKSPYQEEYYLKNREKRLAYSRKWQYENKEKYMAYRRSWLIKNREKRRLWEKEYRANNKEKIRQQNKNRKAAIPWLVKYNFMSQRSREKRTPFFITKQEFFEWYSKQKRECAYCGTTDLSSGKHENGRPLRDFTIDRKNNLLPYTLENICFACWICNKHKGSFFTYEEWKEIAIRYVFPKLQRLQTGNMRCA